MSRSKLGKNYPKADVEATNDRYHAELRRMFKGKKCADCGGAAANWATLKRAKFVCIHCAQKLRSDASNKIKSCMGSYLWHDDEMELMRQANSN